MKDFQPPSNDVVDTVFNPSPIELLCPASLQST
jgi:hypothetical protein